MFLVNYLFSKKKEVSKLDVRQQQQQQYIQIYNHLFKQKQQLQKEDLILILNDNIFSKNLFEHILQQNQQFTQKQYIQLLEYFSQNQYDTPYSDINILQFFSYIFLNLNEYDRYYSINKQQALDLIKNIFNFIIKIDQQTLQSLILFNFESENDTLTLDRFIYSIDTQLIHLKSYLQIHLYQKLKNEQINLILPKYEKADILNENVLSILYLSNINLRNQKNIDLLYSFRYSGTSFNRLSNSIDGYDGQTIILIKHKDKETHKEFIFGAYKNSIWEQDLGYSGNNQTYLFSILPQFHQYFTQKNSQNNYCYYNTRVIDRSVYKAGMGFGGSQFKDFRIWIDDDIETQSYVNNNDQVYENGFIADFHTKKLNIIGLEVWGLGGQHALDKREAFREYQRIEIEKKRKVNKKEFLNDLDKGLLFEKTFAHQAQVQERDCQGGGYCQRDDE